LAPPWRKTPWCEPSDFPPIDELKPEHTIELSASLDQVRKLLAKSLKPERTLIDVVKFSDGKIEEAYRTSAKEPDAGTTVAQPTQGCPAPDFEQANHRATEVLKVFLTPEQVEDFEKHQRFITVGADTGHRYMLTSRNARDKLGKDFGNRSVYDLEERRSLCVHDYTIPAPEELLSLHLFLSLPGREGYIRAIPE